MFRFILPCVLLVAGLIAPDRSDAANFCVAVNGGFGNGGTSFIAPTFSLPTHDLCTPWAGITKTASTVVAFSTGTACVSKDGTVLTLSIFNTDPSFFGANTAASDQIQLCVKGKPGCTISGQDQGYFGGTAAEQTCTATLLNIPVTHD